MHAGQAAHNFEMTQLFGADVHQQVFALGVVAIQALNRILHGSGQFTVSTSELFEQHVAKLRIGRADLHGVHQFLNMVVHQTLRWILFQTFCFLDRTGLCSIPASSELACCISGLLSSVRSESALSSSPSVCARSVATSY